MERPVGGASGFGVARVLALVVLALMLVAVAYSAWIGVRYFGRIGV
ncbi:MAG: hypothetical protein IRZ00_15755 [Gemmatimonadetes bacterium]|nr:hypothetical protein [Gemmatimonadota bacterium]